MPLLWSGRPEPGIADGHVDDVGNIGDAGGQAAGEGRGRQAGKPGVDGIKALAEDAVWGVVAARVRGAVSPEPQLARELVVCVGVGVKT